MRFSSFSPIVALVLGVTAAPAAEAPVARAVPGVNGAAWAEVTQCSYTFSLGYPTYDPNNAIRWDPPVDYIGTIFRYFTYDGWSMTAYSNLGRVNKTSPASWPESSQTNCVGVNGYNYCFAGTFQSTNANPNPSLSVWGPNTQSNHVRLPTSSPDTKVEAKSNAAQTLCLAKWSVDFIQNMQPSPPGGARGATYCTSKWDGTPLPQCPSFKSQTWTYRNQPYTL